MTITVGNRKIFPPVMPLWYETISQHPQRNNDCPCLIDHSNNIKTNRVLGRYNITEVSLIWKVMICKFRLLPDIVTFFLFFLNYPGFIVPRDLGRHLWEFGKAAVDSASCFQHCSTLICHPVDALMHSMVLLNGLCVIRQSGLLH